MKSTFHWICFSFLLLLGTLQSAADGQSTRETQSERLANNTCPAKTINYITHTLPQQCLRTWGSSIQAAETGRLPSARTIVDGATYAKVDLPYGEALPSTEEHSDGVDRLSNLRDNESESFMSFEDWKEMMLRKTGQDPESFKGRRSNEHQTLTHHASDHEQGAFGEEGEISLDFDRYTERTEVIEASSPITSSAEAGEQGATELAHDDKGTALVKSKDAGKTCKERFSYSSFDAGATVLKTSTGAKNAKAILVENKDTYMLLECAAHNKYVIVELSDDILVDTIVLANFEFFSSMIRHFRVSVSDRYPVKMEKWRELGTFEAKNSRDIQPFLVEHPMIWAKYVRVEFLTHYGKEYYCPLSLLRVHGTRMLEPWIDSETGRDDEDEEQLQLSGLPAGPAEVEDTSHGTYGTSDFTYAPDIEVSIDGLCWAFGSLTFFPPLEYATCPSRPAVAVGRNTNGSCSNVIGTESNIVRGASSDETILVSSWSAESMAPSSAMHRSSTEAMLSSFSVEPSSSSPVPSAHTTSSTLNAGSEEAGSLTSMPTTSSSVVPAFSQHVSSSSPPPTSVSSVSPKSSQSSTMPMKNKTIASASASQPSSPTIQESFFKTIAKRLQLLESNMTLSLRYIEDNSKYLQETLQRLEKKEVSRVDGFLGSLNTSVFDEMRRVRQQYDQIWQSTVLALESQREQAERESLALGFRLNLLADEVVFQKRMSIFQSLILLFCLALVVFSRALGSSSVERTPERQYLSTDGSSPQELYAIIPSTVAAVATENSNHSAVADVSQHELRAEAPSRGIPSSSRSTEKVGVSMDGVSADFCYRRQVSASIQPATDKECVIRASANQAATVRLSPPPSPLPQGSAQQNNSEGENSSTNSSPAPGRILHRPLPALPEDMG